MKTRHQLFNDIQELIYGAIENAKMEGDNKCYVTYEFDDESAIELTLQDVDYMLVECFPAGSKEIKSYPNVEKAIYSLDSNWDNVELEPEYDEWNEHGFRDAADYYHWRYG